MSEDKTYPLTLGGKTWDIPELPFGVIKKLQPRLLARNHELVQAHANGGLGSLSEQALDDLADLVVIGVRQVDPDFDRTVLDAMRFRSAELLIAQTTLMRACGLEFIEKAESAEAASDPKA